MNIIGFSGLDRSVPFKRNAFPGLSSREYRIAQGFDSAAALVGDDGIVAAAHEERFSRQKATGAFPVHAIKYCLQAGGVGTGDIDCVAHGFAYEPVKSYFEHDDFTRRQYEEVYAPEVQVACLREHFPDTDWGERFVAVPHHLAHAASAFYLSGFDEALIVITDGMGEIDSMTALVGTPRGMEVIRRVPALHSLGILYGVFTLHLGFFMGVDEYKVMGLAPYGNPRRFYDDIMEFVRLQKDGTYTVSLFAQNKTIEEKETHGGARRVLAEKFGPPRDPESELTQEHKDLAAGLQAVLETCQLHLLRHLKNETGLSRLCMAGGVALNCTCNGLIRRSRMFKQMFVQPASGDDGTALGAALYVHRQHHPEESNRRMTVPLWGPEYDEQGLASSVAERDDCRSVYYESFERLAKDIASRIAEGQIVAWFQGRMEFGPRALGSRSILADPRAPDMRDRINALVKKREGFRPFAPAVTHEAAADYFDVEPGDEDTYAHMLYVMQVKKPYREKLPAITHVDGSARAQTVSREHNPRFWTLLNEFGKIVGIPIVLNTSFNVRGQPIVCTPREAIDTFLFAQLDALVLGNHVLVSTLSSAERREVGAGAIGKRTVG